MTEMKREFEPDRYREGSTQDERLLERVEDLQAMGMDAWRIFLKRLESQHGHRNALMLMHTDPMDQEGPNLFKICEMMGIIENVFL